VNPLDEKHYRILKKCASSYEFADLALHESSVANLIIEQIDPKDIKEVQDAVNSTREILKSLVGYAKTLRLDEELKDLFDYIKELEGALDKAQSSLADVSFDRGAIMNFFGSKATLPDLASSTIILNARAADFANGFLRALQNIQDNLVPILSDVDDSETLANAAGANPNIDLEKISAGLNAELKKSLGGTMFGKVKSFFQQGIGSSAGSKVLKSLPKRDMAVLAKTISDALINAKISNLLGQDIPTPDDSEVRGLEDEMKDIADAAPDEGEEGEDAKENEEETSEDIDADLEAAAKEAAETSKSPTDGALDALDSWVEKLSASSQQTLRAGGRLDALKSGIKDRLERSADAISGEIEGAIGDWRAEHEETLVKSKRFSKKNFDTLQKLVPNLTSFMLKQVEESAGKLTRDSVRQFTYLYLNRLFARRNRLDESNSKTLRRWQKLAGLIQ